MATLAPPVPQAVALAMVSLAVLSHQPGVALALYLCWEGMLRIGEALALRANDIIATAEDEVCAEQRRDRRMAEGRMADACEIAAR